MKIDVEGNEVNILESALPFVVDGTIARISVEVNAKRVAQLGCTTNRWNNLFTTLYKAQYVVAINTPTSHSTLGDVLNRFKLAIDSPDIWFIFKKPSGVRN